MTKTITFEKIVGGGKALGYLDGKPAFASGPLPGEVAEVSVTKDKSDFVEVSVVKLVSPSKHRSGNAEGHYLACSPWQDVDYTYQLELKRGVLADAFRRPGLQVNVVDVVASPQTTGYRNKLEFSLMPGADGLQLAFHDRGSYEGRMAAPDGCVLGSAVMNAAAVDLATRAHALKLDGYLETITVRQSASTGEVIGHLALHQAPTKRAWGALSDSGLAGVMVSKLRGRGQHELLWHADDASLMETVGGVDLEYPYDGFFQTNIAMFEGILKTILAQVPASSKVVDLYGGVGTIGLSAAKIAREVVGVEINQSSVELAVANAARAGIANYRGIAGSAQSLETAVLAGSDCVILDPPRAGLDRSVVKALLAAGPARILYLSCNPVTQARDVAWLAEGYAGVSVTGYDMYPGTLHLESFIILEHR